MGDSPVGLGDLAGEVLLIAFPNVGELLLDDVGMGLDDLTATAHAHQEEEEFVFLGILETVAGGDTLDLPGAVQGDGDLGQVDEGQHDDGSDDFQHFRVSVWVGATLN